MLFTFNQDRGKSSEGRSIGGGRDKSAPTEIPIHLLVSIIGPLRNSVQIYERTWNSAFPLDLCSKNPYNVRTRIVS